MTDHPVLVETGAGVVGGVVTTPGRTERAAAVILQGQGGTRAGTNQLWVRVAHALADVGLVTLRADYPGSGESHLADVEAATSGARDLVRWFRERTNELDLLVVAFCFGLLPAARLVKELDRIAGIAMIVPPLTESTNEGEHRRTPSVRRRAIRRARAAGRAPRQLLLRARYGTSPAPNLVVRGEHFVRGPELLTRLVHRAPVCFLTGELDHATGPLCCIYPELAEAGDCELEMVEGITLRSYRTPQAQDVILDRTVAWARRCLEPTRLAR